MANNEVIAAAQFVRDLVDLHRSEPAFVFDLADHHFESVKAQLEIEDFSVHRPDGTNGLVSAFRVGVDRSPDPPHEPAAEPRTPYDQHMTPTTPNNRLQ